MILYLVRHAMAEPRGALPDSQRALTETGTIRMHRHARALVRLEERIDGILTSPLVRARQTAEILAREFVSGPKVVVEDRLAPGGDALALIQSVVQRYAGLRVALVGHEPDMSGLLSLLISGSAQAEFDFKKGAVARVDLDEDTDPNRGWLRWFLTPKQLRTIAG